MEYFKDECEKFSKIRLRIAKMCFGQEHDDTQKSEKKKMKILRTGAKILFESVWKPSLSNHLKNLYKEDL